MKLAVTYENGNVFAHFGHTEQFKMYEISGHSIDKSEVVGTEGQGHGALAGFLQANGVDVLICGGIGAGAQNALNAAGIRILAGVSGNADAAAEACINGTLSYSDHGTCAGHEHEHGHSCGHNCGHHSCGKE